MHLDLLGISGGGSATEHLDPRRRQVRALWEDMLDGPSALDLRAVARWSPEGDPQGLVIDENGVVAGRGQASP
jgi:hypothetical protein